MNINLELFKDLDDNEMMRLNQISSLKNYAQGNFLFMEGEAPKVLHLLLDGIVKVYKLDPKGNEIVMHFFQPQTLIAETAHMQNINYPASAICVTDAKVLEIDYEAFEKDFLRNPDISFKIIHSLSQKVKALQTVIDMNLAKDTFSRICSFLYEHRNHLENFSSKDIAEILHTKPETLSRNFAILKKKKIISIEKRKIILLDKDKLLEFC